METQAKGASFLKVTGILMIIGGSISILLTIIALSGVAAIIALGLGNAMLYISSIVLLASSVAQLVAGIIGVKNCKNPEKAQSCITWGIIVSALCVLGEILSVIGGGSFSFFSLLLGLVLPVLYTVGAIKNKQG